MNFRIKAKTKTYPTIRNHYKNTAETQKPTIKPNSLPLQSRNKGLHSPPLIKKKSVNHQPISEIIPKTPKPNIENFPFPTNEIPKVHEQLPKISKSQPSKKEQILLARIKELEEHLKATQAENEKLKIEKEQAKTLTQTGKNRADYYQRQLKIIAKSLYQWTKINHYRQLEKKNRNELEIYSAEQVKIEQPPKPPPWKI